ncbi:aspergillopepsin [Epithele typhae]|uniref:aspergillopepsin n=1 Tax=Epithele typhae TaxID=378194 RepID=UPI002008CAB9|nr:aspergillopepsin [Epithele typhae]KAH9940060.1 aspergillopepsin [Epithele typhae]
MVAFTVLSQLLLAASALAVPTSSERFASRAARRAAGLNRQSRPKIASSGLSAEFTNSSNVDYSSNWSGAVLVASTATYKSVTGTFTVPSPKEPSGGSGEHSASAWVGIDGDTCGTAILQTGLDFTISGSSVSYDAWYEWYPDYAYDFSGISFSSGDTVTVTVTATSKTAGTAKITNVSTGKSVSHSFSGQPSLCEYNAEWIVEDFEEGSSLVPFANFGTVTFTNAKATTNSGSTVTPSGSDLIDIEQNGKVLTSVSTSGSTVTVKYTG